ncbi:MAG: hypothetical protein Q4C83_00210 [Candidatus Saccharibacteria bacterium]|nr:hypothetical protein [Candidatus Saccharibacteria bacterium]
MMLENQKIINGIIPKRGLFVIALFGIGLSLTHGAFYPVQPKMDHIDILNQKKEDMSTHTTVEPENGDFYANPRQIRNKSSDES